ncbi:MAG: type VI secretion system tube protein Hcp [Acidimicrobiales bacterium]
MRRASRELEVPEVQIRSQSPRGPGILFRRGVVKRLREGAGKVTFNPFTITRRIDRASPYFYQDYLARRFIASMTLYVTPPAGSAGTSTGDSVKLSFSKVQIRSFTWSSAGSSGAGPTESMTMTYAKVSVTYTP